MAGINHLEDFEVHNALHSEHNQAYAEFLYQRLQRQGYLYRDCQRLVKNDRNVFAACMVALGHADAMVTGVTRNFSTAFHDVRRVLDPKRGRRVIGVSVIISRGRVVLVADTSVHAMPDSEELADIAVEAAAVASRFGMTPRVAMLAFSTFGNPPSERAERVREAVKLLDQRHVEFEYDGEMGADVALNKRAMALYPFCRLTDTANVLVMPAFHAASISTKMLQELGGGTVIGPILGGPVEAGADCFARFERQRPCEHGRARCVRRDRIAEPRDAAPGRLEKAYPPIAREGGRRGAVGNAPRTAADAPCLGDAR